MKGIPLLECPQCKEMDQVQKVSAIHRAGTSIINQISPTIIYTPDGPQTRIIATNATQQTELSALLQPPALPPVPGTNEVGGQLLLASLSVIITAYVFQSASQPFRTLGPLLLFLLWLLLAFLMHTGYRAVRKDQRKQQQELSIPVQKQLQEWNKFYHCYRCDGVFVAGETTIVPPDKIKQLYT